MSKNYELKDIGDGKPVMVEKCPMCGISPGNVDDCGCFGDSKCPYFGKDSLSDPSPENYDPYYEESARGKLRRNARLARPNENGNPPLAWLWLGD